MLPIDDRRSSGSTPTIAGRPQLITGNTQVLFPGMRRLCENSVIDIKNHSFTVTAAIDVAADTGAERGHHRPGRPLRRLGAVRQGRAAKFVYNVLGMQEFITEATQPIPAGAHQVRVEFAYDGGGLGKGGNVTLYSTASAVGTGRVDVTQPLIFSADETTDIGDDYGMPVSADYVGGQQVQRASRWCRSMSARTTTPT